MSAPTVSRMTDLFQLEQVANMWVRTRAKESRKGAAGSDAYLD